MSIPHIFRESGLTPKNKTSLPASLTISIKGNHKAKSAGDDKYRPNAGFLEEYPPGVEFFEDRLAFMGRKISRSAP